MDILFICKDRSVGYVDAKYGLWNSASFVSKTLEKYKISSLVLTVPDSNYIDREIAKYKPKIVVLEALWVPPYKIKELTQLHKKVKFICRIHSKATFLANEGIAFEWMNEYSDLRIRLSANSYEFNEDLNQLGYNSLYLPNIYYNFGQQTPVKLSPNWLHISCFGSLRPMKNHLNQAIAAIEFAAYRGWRLAFHINATRAEQKGENVLKNLRALFDKTPNTVLLEHGWLSHKEFLSLIGGMHISMQVSLSESFNIVTADAISQNVAVVTSPEIEFVSSNFLADPGSTLSMTDALWRAYYGSKIGSNKLNQWHLNSSITAATKTWIKYLQTAL